MKIERMWRPPPLLGDCSMQVGEETRDFRKDGDPQCRYRAKYKIDGKLMCKRHAATYVLSSLENEEAVFGGWGPQGLRIHLQANRAPKNMCVRVGDEEHWYQPNADQGVIIKQWVKWQKIAEELLSILKRINRKTRSVPKKYRPGGGTIDAVARITKEAIDGTEEAISR